MELYLKDINMDMITKTARVSCIWDSDGQWVDMNYSYDDELGYGEYQTCFAELYDDGNPTEETWQTAQAVAKYIFEAINEYLDYNKYDWRIKIDYKNYCIDVNEE